MVLITNVISWFEFIFIPRISRLYNFSPFLLDCIYIPSFEIIKYKVNILNLTWYQSSNPPKDYILFHSFLCVLFFVMAKDSSISKVTYKSSSSDQSPFTQLEALQKLLSQSSDQLIAAWGTGMLAMRDNKSVACFINKRTTKPWILDSRASDLRLEMHLFFPSFTQVQEIISLILQMTHPLKLRTHVQS